MANRASRSAPARIPPVRRRRSARRSHPRSRTDDGGDGRHPRRGAGSAAHRAARQRRISSTKRDKYTGIRQAGPESLRHFKRTFKRALRRQIASRAYDPSDPIVMPIRSDKQYRSWKDVQQPQSVAVIIYMMDVSGSMTDEQKEIVRIEAFWIDTWIKAPLQGRRDGLHHPRCRRPGSGRTHVLPHARKRRHEDQLGVHAGRQDHRRPLFAGIVERVCLPFRDGDNWGDDIPHCIELLQEKLLPR